MNPAPRTVCGALVACALLAGVISLPGCARQDSAEVKPAAAGEAQSYLGPFPMGVAVGDGQTRVTLDTVEVSELEWPYEEPDTAAPAGSAWVYADFAFDGPGSNPAPGGGRLYPQFELFADGKSVPISVRSSGGDMEAPPGVVPHEYFTFLVPDNARSLVLRVTPKSSDTQPIAFRLW